MIVLSTAFVVADDEETEHRVGQRPRLADGVVVRRNVVGDEERIALLCVETRRNYLVDARAWTLLAACDGTRDLAGIAAAAARHGVFIGEGHLRRFLDELARSGLLDDGAPEDLLEGVPSNAREDKPVIEMPNARYLCDGRGGCCSTYATIVVTPDDVHRACATLPERSAAGHRPTHAFLPLAGSAPTVLRALSHEGGACMYLDRDQRCSLHRVGGPSAKPVGCRWYPARLIDIGAEIRVVPSVECSCVARPVEGGEPLVPDGIATAAQLPLGVISTSIADTVEIAQGVAIERARAFGWVDAITDGLCDHDPVDYLWRCAADTSLDTKPVSGGDVAAELARRFAALAPRCRARAEQEAAWRGSNHMLVGRLSVMAAAAELLAAPTAMRALLTLPPLDPGLENHVLRAHSFGRLWLVDAPALDRLRATAVTLAWARALPSFLPDDVNDVTTSETPLAAIQATWRVALAAS